MLVRTRNSWNPRLALLVGMYDGRKWDGGSSKNQTKTYHIIQQSHFLAYAQKSKRSWMGICTPMFTQHFFTIAKEWKETTQCPWANGWVSKMWTVQTGGQYSVLNRKHVLTPATTSWTLRTPCWVSRASHQRTNPVWSTYLRDREESIQRQKVGRWVPGTGEGWGVSVSRGWGFSLGRWGVPEVGGGDSCTTTPMCSMPLSCALRNG